MWPTFLPYRYFAAQLLWHRHTLTKTSAAFYCTVQPVPFGCHGPCILNVHLPNIQFIYSNDVFSLLSVGGVPAVLQLDQKSRSVDLQSSVRLTSWSSLSIRNSFNFTSYYTAPPCDSNNFYFETFERSKNQHSNKMETILVLFGTPLNGKKSQASMNKTKTYLLAPLESYT